MSIATMRELFEAGAHFGHRACYWNPKMAPYIYGKRGDIHIINLEKTVPMLEEALNFLGAVVASGGQVMFVGTKRPAQEAIKNAASRCGMPYVNFRWLGGMMTNFKTIRQSVRHLEEIEKQLEDIEKNADTGNSQRLTKKEIIKKEHEKEKLNRSLAGIRDMRRLPDILFVVDVGYEKIAIKEARKLGIPVIGIVDTNGDIDGVDYIIPGNDDSVRAIKLYLESAADAVEAAKATAVGKKGKGRQEAENEAEAESSTEENNSEE
ncbi:MAG: 30S ribosomal protein S2 [Cardiobacteriaceae bacterium]|nr:30S ribosomal protein S2 [Cardiobacteriaceae bacterium]